MRYELFLTGLMLIILGIEPLMYFLYGLYRKRTWRVCIIEKITLVTLQDLMPFNTFKDKQMLVEYGFEQKTLSTITDFNKKLYKVNQQKPKHCQIYVDPSNPEKIFLPKQSNNIIMTLLVIAGFGLLFIA